MAQGTLGYDDTPLIPNSKWHVHDCNRPQRRVVTPAPVSDPTAPPSDAVILFDGNDLSKWELVDGGDAPWIVQDGYMEVIGKSGSIRTRDTFGDCQLHLEWAAPEVIEGDSQGRGNSGVFLMERYEIQVLDCFDNPTYADGSTASIYGEYPPLVNACRKPGEWQTYDIVWIAPRFEGDTLSSPARVTVIHNGIIVQHDQELFGPTGHKRVQEYVAHPPEGHLMLQDHKNPVRFRNIWYRALGEQD